jgi:hypothetical protein
LAVLPSVTHSSNVICKPCRGHCRYIGVALHLSRHINDVLTGFVVLVVPVRARAPVEDRIRSAVDIREAARIREAVCIQEVVGSKLPRSANICGPTDRDGNPADKDKPRIGSVLVLQETAKSRDCKYADT